VNLRDIDGLGTRHVERKLAEYLCCGNFSTLSRAAMLTYALRPGVPPKLVARRGSEGSLSPFSAVGLRAVGGNRAQDLAGLARGQRQDKTAPSQSAIMLIVRCSDNPYTRYELLA
jgi:hypothetical protein